MQSDSSNMNAEPCTMVMVHVVMVPVVMVPIVPCTSMDIPAPYTTAVVPQSQPSDKVPIKLRNRKIMKEPPLHLFANPNATEEVHDNVITRVLARKEEQRLRLASDALGETSYDALDVDNIECSTCSDGSDIASSEEQDDEFTLDASLSAPELAQRQPPRIQFLEPQQNIVDLLSRPQVVQSELGLNEELAQQADAIINAVESALRRKFDSNFTMHVGGSYGKGTSLCCGFDADLTLKIEDYDYRKWREYQKAALDSLRALAESHSLMTTHEFMLKFKVGGLAFDLVLTGSISGFEHAPAIARKWAFTSSEEDSYVKQAIEAQPFLRSFILLAKHWLKSRAWPSMKGPKSFFAELLCIEIAKEHVQTNDLVDLFHLLLAKVLAASGHCTVISPAGQKLGVVEHDAHALLDLAKRTSAKMNQRQGMARLASRKSSKPHDHLLTK